MAQCCAVEAVNLCAPEATPLQAKADRICIAFYETRNEVSNQHNLAA